MTEEPEKITTINLVSDELGLLGPTLRTSIQALPSGDGRYLVSLDEWDATLGPVFDRSLATLDADDSARSYMAVAFGYEAMNPEEVSAHRSLVQAFDAADALKAGPQAFDAFLARYRTADMELNNYGQQLKEFAETLVNDGHVLVSREQLQGLVDIARRGMDYIAANDAAPASAQFFDTNVKYNPRMDYCGGLFDLTPP